MSEKYAAIACEAQGRVVVTATRWKGLSKRHYKAQRGKITIFSKESRKRLLQKVNRMSLNTIDIKFITLTYAAMFPDAKTAKQHLRAFLERIRRAHPESSGIWRIEYQKRGAPHFHLLMFNLPFIDKEYLRDVWGDVIGTTYWDYSKEWQPKPPFTRIERIITPKRAISYVSKYIAKVSAASGFNSSTYLHEGRWWGVFNEKNLPYAEKFEYIIVASTGKHWEALQIWKAAVDNAHAGSGRLSEITRGGMLYSDKAYFYLGFMQYLMSEWLYMDIDENEMS